ncbi:MAG TPA: FAD-dependent monooxygenase, partial [Steroidobacteraceae bacterium]
MRSAAAANVLEVDVAIIGGGMVGASLAAALAGSARRLLLVESIPFGAAAQPSFDERTTALGNASRRIFEGLGVWSSIAPEAAAIRTIHVSEAGRFGFARLEAAEQGIEAFGYVAPNRSIGAALWRALREAPRLSLQAPARAEDLAVTEDSVRFVLVNGADPPIPVRARLLVAADGAHSQVRAAAGIAAQTMDYEQIAVVANVGSERPHAGCAYERFTPSGPLAVLPRHDGGFAVIWACRPARAQELLALDDDAYLRELQTHFGWRAGRFVRAGRRSSYPLKLTRALSAAALRTVLIGNAAQA